MVLDVLKLCRSPKCRHVPVQIPHPLVQIRISRPDVANVALEVLHVNRVEADDRGVQPHICFCDVGAEVVRTGVFIVRKVLLGSVE